MALVLDLQKSAGNLQLSLQKRGIQQIPPVDVAFDLDVSGSYDDEHRDGITNDLMARLVPWGLVCDPDKKLDVFTFSYGRSYAHYVGEVNERNYQDYVRKNVIGKVPGYGSGTTYADVLQLNREHFGWAPSQTAPAKRGLFGSRPAQPAAQGVKRKSLILFNTDGANDDKDQTTRLFEEMERKGDQIYVAFIGVSNQPGTFRYIEQLGDRFSNCGFVAIPDVKSWVRKTDEEINDELITDELVTWLQK